MTDSMQHFLLPVYRGFFKHRFKPLLTGLLCITLLLFGQSLMAAKAQATPKKGVEAKVVEKEKPKADAELATTEAEKPKSDTGQPTKWQTQLTGGYFLPMGFGKDYFNNGFSGKGAAAIQITRHFVPYASAEALFYGGKSFVNSGYFYHADGGLSVPLNLTSSIVFLPYAAAGVLGGSLKSTEKQAKLLVPALDAGFYLTWYFSNKMGISFSTSVLYALDTQALLFTNLSAGLGLRF